MPRPTHAFIPMSLSVYSFACHLPKSDISQCIVLPLITMLMLSERVTDIFPVRAGEAYDMRALYFEAARADEYAARTRRRQPRCAACAASSSYAQRMKERARVTQR